MSDEFMNRARELLALRDKATQKADDGLAGMLAKMRACNDFIDSAHDMADTISDLLAEVERLTIRESALSDAHVEIHGHRFACSQAVANYVQQINDQRVTAESRLRELASAEPVAWVDGENFVWPKGKRRPSNCDALIRRPEMPS